MVETRTLIVETAEIKQRHWYVKILIHAAVAKTK
jgi:hypothetical protein